MILGSLRTKPCLTTSWAWTQIPQLNQILPRLGDHGSFTQWRPRDVYCSYRSDKRVPQQFLVQKSLVQIKVAVIRGVSPIVGQAHFHDSFPHFDWLNLHFGWFWKIPISIGRILIWVKPPFLNNPHIFWLNQLHANPHMMLFTVYVPLQPLPARFQQRFDGPAFGCLGHGIGAPTEYAAVFLGGLGGHLGDRPAERSANNLW